MKAYETKKKLALSLAVAMVASSAPVLAFADTTIVAQAEAEMTVEEIIEKFIKEGMLSMSAFGLKVPGIGMWKLKNRYIDRDIDR